jgi:hypothetical protein
LGFVVGLVGFHHLRLLLNHGLLVNLITYTCTMLDEYNA